MAKGGRAASAAKGAVPVAFALVSVGGGEEVVWDNDVLGMTAGGILHGLHDDPLFTVLFEGVGNLRACRVCVAVVPPAAGGAGAALGASEHEEEEEEGDEEEGEEEEVLGRMVVGDVEHRKVTNQNGKVYVHIYIDLPLAGGGGGSGAAATAAGPAAAAAAAAGPAATAAAAGEKRAWAAAVDRFGGGGWEEIAMQEAFYKAVCSRDAICALCGGDDDVKAAHIMRSEPFGTVDELRKALEVVKLVTVIDTRNAILLCYKCHDVFDAGLWSVDAKGKVVMSRALTTHFPHLAGIAGRQLYPDVPADSLAGNNRPTRFMWAWHFEAYKKVTAARGDAALELLDCPECDRQYVTERHCEKHKAKCAAEAAFAARVGKYQRASKRLRK